jgi:hypothetical protein
VGALAGTNAEAVALAGGTGADGWATASRASSASIAAPSAKHFFAKSRLDGAAWRATRVSCGPTLGRPLVLSTLASTSELTSRRMTRLVSEAKALDHRSPRSGDPGVPRCIDRPPVAPGHAVVPRHDAHRQDTRRRSAPRPIDAPKRPARAISRAKAAAHRLRSGDRVVRTRRFVGGLRARPEPRARGAESSAKPASSLYK